jgi:hypothetical protein
VSEKVFRKAGEGALFGAITQMSPRPRKPFVAGRSRNGTQIGPSRFRTKHGVELFFYDEQSITEESSIFGLTKYAMVEEPINIQLGSSTAFGKISCHRG